MSQGPSSDHTRPSALFPEFSFLLSVTPFPVHFLSFSSSMITLFQVISSCSVFPLFHWFLVCMRIYVCIGWWWEVSPQCSGSGAASIFVCLYLRFGISLWHGLFRLGCLASKPRDLLPLSVSWCWECKCHSCLLAFMWMVGMSSGPPACTASSLLSEPSLQSSSLVSLPKFNLLLLILVLHCSHLRIVWLNTINEINKELHRVTVMNYHSGSSNLGIASLWLWDSRLVFTVSSFLNFKLKLVVIIHLRPALGFRSDIF